ATVPIPLGPFCLDFLRLGALGFGGPIALVGSMQRDLVERRRWIDKDDYLEGLALAQLAPGPLGAAFVLGRRAIVDIPTVLIALATVAVLSKVKRVPEPLVIVAA